jgi:hypothetical protein
MGMTGVLGLIGDEKATKAARSASVKMHFDKARERNDKNRGNSPITRPRSTTTGRASRVSAAGTCDGEGGDGSASSSFGDDWGLGAPAAIVVVSCSICAGARSQMFP